MRRSVVTPLVLAIACAALLASPASAAKPFMQRISDPIEVVLDGDDFCGFDVLAEVEQRFKYIEFSRNRGTFWTALTVGKIKVVLTNLEDPDRTVRLSIPGPGFLDASGNTLRGTGPWVVFVPGSLLYLRGNITFEAGPFGVQPARVRGTTIDLCDVLG